MINFLQAKDLLLINKNYWHILSVGFMSAFLLSTLFLGQFFWLYLITLAVCLLAILLAPSAGLYTIFLCTIWFERHFTLQELVWGDTFFKIYPLDFIILFTVFSVGLRAVVQRRWIKFRKFDVFILLFGGLCTLGFALSFVHHAHFSYAFSTYKNYFLYAVIYFLSYWLLVRRRDWQEFMIWLTIGWLGVFFFLFYGIANGAGLWSEYTPLSTVGSRLIAGTHVFYLTIFGFWVLGGWLFKRPLSAKLGDRGNLLVLALVILALLVSLVRHLWLALIILGAIWLIFLAAAERKRLWILLKGCLITLVIGLTAFAWFFSLWSGSVPPSFAKAGYILASRASVVNVVSLRDDSFRWRVNAWITGLNLWQASPIWGVGLGQLVVGEDEGFIYEVPIRELHNDYLGILIQLGLIGLVFVAMWFYYLVARIYRLWQRAKRESGFSPQMVFTWGSTVLLFMIIFSISVYWDLNLFLIWWWLALGAVRFLIYENFTDK